VGLERFLVPQNVRAVNSGTFELRFEAGTVSGTYRAPEVLPRPSSDPEATSRR
jgi:hypothetical protein